MKNFKEKGDCDVYNSHKIGVWSLLSIGEIATGITGLFAARANNKINQAK